MNLIKRIGKWRPFGAFRRSRRGIAATEFALTIPIWVTLALGCSDGAICLLQNERVDRIAYTVADIITQQESLTNADLANISQAAGQLMQPFSFDGNGYIIYSSIYKEAGKSPVIKWQRVNGTAASRASKIGVQGGIPTLPAGLTVNDNENLIVAEVFYKYTPMFVSAGLFTTNDVYRYAIYKPRLSQLTTPPT